MRTEMPVEQLLLWRLARAESEAPPAPRGERLLELARPSWETWPQRLQSLVQRVGRMQIAYGHAMAEPCRAGGGYPVPALVVRLREEIETSVRVLYFNVRDGRLRLRFQLDGKPEAGQEAFDMTFVEGNAARPLLSAKAALSVDNEYRVDAELSEELARDWELLRVKDRMPFRLILRAAADSG